MNSQSDRRIVKLEKRIAALEEALNRFQQTGFIPVSQAARLLGKSGEALRKEIRIAEADRACRREPRLRLNYHYQIISTDPNGLRPTYKIHLERYRESRGIQLPEQRIPQVINQTSTAAESRLDRIEATMEALAHLIGSQQQQAEADRALMLRLIQAIAQDDNGGKRL